jgi:DsbC/DsbD-like thiol-disulfide interchange protein
MFLTSRQLFYVAGLCFLAVVSHAQTSSKVTPQMQAELVAYAPDGVDPQHVTWVGLRLKHAPLWHTYWINPGDAGDPPSLSWQLPQGIKIDQTLWPLPHQIKTTYSSNYGYENEILIASRLNISPDFFKHASQTLQIQLHANWQVCGTVCIAQQGDFEIQLPLHTKQNTHRETFNALFSQQPQTLASVQIQSHLRASKDNQFLDITMAHLPSRLQNLQLELYPLTPQILAADGLLNTAASQNWHQQNWQAHIPLSRLRTQNIKQLDALLIVNQPDRQGWIVHIPIKDHWPAPLPEQISQFDEHLLIKPSQSTKPPSLMARFLEFFK